jgi:hypothetical protein
MGIMADGRSMALYPFMGSLHLYNGQGKISVFFFFFFFKLIKNTLLLVYHWSENVFLLIGRLLKNTFQIGRICWYLLMNPVLALQKKKKKKFFKIAFCARVKQVVQAVLLGERWSLKTKQLLF